MTSTEADRPAPAPDHTHDHDHAHDDGPRTGSPRPAWVGPVAVGLGGALAIAYTAWQDPNGDGVFPQCPTREVFGVDCPGCGGLRAVHALTRGDVLAAVDHNVLAVVIVPLAIVAWALWLAHSLGVAVPRPPRLRRPALIALGLGLLAFTVVRNIGGVALFEYLHSSA